MLNSLLAQANLLNEPQGDAALDPMGNTAPAYGIGPSVVDTRRQELLDVKGKPREIKSQPGQVDPAWRTQDAMKIGAALLLAHLFGGKKKGELATGIVKGYASGKNQKAALDTQKKAQEYQIGQAQLDEQRRADEEKAALNLSFALQDQQMALQATENELKRKDAETKLTLADQDKARMGYQNANTEGEKDFWAARLRAIDPQNAPTEAMVLADKSQMKAGRVNNALTRWNTIVRSWMNDYGELNEAQVAQAMKARNAIAQEFMIDPESLPLPMTGSTLKKQMQEARIADLELKGIKTIDDSARAWAKLHADSEYRIKKLEQDAARALQTGNTAAFNANTRRMEAERKATGEQSNKMAERKITSLRAKLRGLEAKQKTEPSTTKRRSIQGEIDAVKAEMGIWKQQVEPASTTPQPNNPGLTNLPKPTTLSDGTAIRW